MVMGRVLWGAQIENVHGEHSSGHRQRELALAHLGWSTYHSPQDSDILQGGKATYFPQSGLNCASECTMPGVQLNESLSNELWKVLESLHPGQAKGNCLKQKAGLMNVPISLISQKEQGKF